MTKFADTEEKRRLTVTDILVWSLFEQKNRAKKKWQIDFWCRKLFRLFWFSMNKGMFEILQIKQKKISRSLIFWTWINHEIICFRLCRLRVKLVYFWVRNFSNFYERIADVRFWNQSRGQKRSLQLVSLRQTWFFFF